MKPLGKVRIRWSPEFAYAIGLITTDGNLSSDGRHISLVSNDKEQILTLKKCLGIDNKIGRHISGSGGRQGFRVQLGDINFYKFLCSIGLMPNKSKILDKIKIPNEYFFDFLRGHFDGDGTFYSYWDPRWRSSFMLYTVFISASRRHIDWLREKIFYFLGIEGHRIKREKNLAYELRYAKHESLKLLKRLYAGRGICLSRKRLKIEKALATIGLRI